MMVTDKQKQARERENAKTLHYLASKGNKKAKKAITVKGGKK